jgi:hypothetical protein
MRRLGKSFDDRGLGYVLMPTFSGVCQVLFAGRNSQLRPSTVFDRDGVAWHGMRGEARCDDISKTGRLAVGGEHLIQA